MMPQSLMVSGGSSSGSSAKRQRSADSREVPTKPKSTGLNRSNGSLSKPTLTIPSYLEKSRVEISQAFQDLEWKQRFRLFHALEHPTTSPFRVDRSEIVINRNRYGNVQPWDNSRVKLKTPVDGSDYVNASPIALRSRGINQQDGKDGHGTQEFFQESRYIATQGPKDCSIPHFWQMVMQESIGEVGVIVMLTQCYESYKEKCSQYFPSSMISPILNLHPDDDRDTEESTDDVTEDHMGQARHNDTVEMTASSEDDHTCSQHRIFTLTIDGQSKTIHHYLFRGWPDFGKPEAEDRTALLELIRQTRQMAGESPRIVHCSAGVGRTGTFIALDFLMHEIEEGRISDLKPSGDSISFRDDLSPTTETWGKSGPPKVKTPTGADFPSGEENNALRDDLIYDTVNLLREQRMMMVMNELQYSFLYEVIREVFLAKYKGRPEGAVVKEAGSTSSDLPRGKVAKVDDLKTEEASGSEAETEIMDGDEGVAKAGTKEAVDVENDPYNVVAPQHIREGIAKDMQQ